jgi:hypothetical protein
VTIIPRFRGICHYFDPLPLFVPLFKHLPRFATILIKCHFFIKSSRLLTNFQKYCNNSKLEIMLENPFNNKKKCELFQWNLT